MSIDLNILSLYRLNGQEQAGLPGLAVFAPPRKAARGREREQLLVSLLLNGNTPFSSAEYEKLVNSAAATYHGAHGSLTSALRSASESVNRALLERNLSTTGRGQYAIGWLTLASLRENQLTILQCGPTHVFALSNGVTRHLHDPALSGKGLGLSQSISHFFSQVQLQPGDRLLVCPKLPPAWENAFSSDHGLPALEATRKRMLSVADGDVNGALIQATEGKGGLFLVSNGTPPPPPPPKPVASSPAVDSAPALIPLKPAPDAIPPAHVVGRPPADAPSAYAIPPQPAQADEELVEQLANVAMARQFPPSIPRATPPEPEVDSDPVSDIEEEPEFEAVDVTATPRRSADEIAASRAEGKRQMARTAVNGIQTWRRVTGQVGERIRKFLPNLLPGGESDLSLPIPAMAFISILVPLLVVTIAVVVYMRFGVSSQYDTYIEAARLRRQQALTETNPVRQRDAWNDVIQRVKQVQSYNDTDEAKAMLQEARSRLDSLLGITRLNFNPIFSSDINADISRMAASDSDLYMLDATQGNIMRAAIDRGYELDVAFDCRPGTYGNIKIGSLVDLLVLPKGNMLSSSVLGVDAAGNLLYCAPGQVSRPMTLPLPPTYWGRVTAMTLDGGSLALDGNDVKLEGAKLYVLDAPASMIWTYTDKEGVFVDTPLMFFGNQIPEKIQDAIDIAVSGDELYLLHSDGRITYCQYSRLDGVPTRCDSPVELMNKSFTAYGDSDVFSQAHFTQMTLTGLPASTLLLLDADGQSVYRLSTVGFELQGILGAADELFPAGQIGAMTVSPGRILYLARGGQVYAATDAP